MQVEMKRLIQKSRSLFSLWLRAIHKYFAKTAALACIALYAVFVWGFFSDPDISDFSKGRWVSCGNLAALKQGTSMFDQDILALEIQDVQPSRFVLSGRLELSRDTYLKHFRNAKGISVMLDRLQTHASALPGPFYWIEVEKPQDREIGDRRQITLKLKNRELSMDGNLERFPFDDYRLGFTASVRVLKPGAGSYRDQPMEAVIINTHVSNAFVVKKVQRTGQFLRNPERSSFVKSHERYSVDQCALIFERPLWYRAMIFFLLMILFAPAVYLYYKRDADPGVELIAAILGVAAIRAYLLGGFAEWDFYWIDAAFGLAVLSTAIIPLWRLPRCDI